MLNWDCVEIGLLLKGRRFGIEPEAFICMPQFATTVHLPDAWELYDQTSRRGAIIAALTEDLSFHKRIRGALSAAGLKVRTVQKHWFHDVYEVRMQRGADMRDFTHTQLRQKIRRALSSEGINYDKRTFALSLRGRTLVCAFCFKLGGEGVVI